LFQALLARGIAVFAPNVRGSTGYGRTFEQADDLHRRFDGIQDVADCVDYLVHAGIAEPGRIGVGGRSYGGYLTLAALVTYPDLFRAGVDICGVADFETFYTYTEPWIAATAVTKYGDPDTDRALLRMLSPLHRMDALAAPLLVVHGTNDTNVPLCEADQTVAAARSRGIECHYLLFEDEGHEVAGLANRILFVRAVLDWLTEHLLGTAGPEDAAKPRVTARKSPGGARDHRHSTNVTNIQS
jgi:dipeptidyl aminopeptidase/acylaminoacyl peptidase